MGDIGSKVRHVVSSRQTRRHGCHWPGCPRQVPPAKWGCRDHWYMLPKALRDAIWRAYRVGQEASGSVSREYVDAARDAQVWIASRNQRAQQGLPSHG